MFDEVKILYSISLVFFLYVRLYWGCATERKGGQETAWAPAAFFSCQERCQGLPSQLSAQCFRIRDILVRIRIFGFVPLTNGSGSDSVSWSCSFLQWASRRKQKIVLFSPSFYAYFFLGTLTSFFKDKKSSRSHKTVEIKVFLTIFACWRSRIRGSRSRRPNNIRIRNTVSA